MTIFLSFTPVTNCTSRLVELLPAAIAGPLVPPAIAVFFLIEPQAAFLQILPWQA